jgi:endoribonuclease Dicer
MTAQPPTVSDDSLIPRRYQEEIFEKAVHGNVIAALDTGSGKTLISTLLIKWVSTQGNAREKFVVFLVPKVALAQQQSAFIAKHSPLRVKQATGATAPDMSDRIGWQELLSNVDVIVLTGKSPPFLLPFTAANLLPKAQLFLNVITHSHWSIHKVREFR